MTFTSIKSLKMGPSDRYMFMEVFIIFDGLDVYDSGNSQESASDFMVVA